MFIECADSAKALSDAGARLVNFISFLDGRIRAKGFAGGSNMANPDNVAGWHFGNPADEAAKVASTVGDMANQVKDKVTQLGRSASQKVDDGRVSTAEVLQGSADSLRSAGQSSSETLASAAKTSADKLESTAKYLRENDFESMMKDVEHVVRRNPTRSLVAALAVGFLAGAAIRNRN